jgi:hypothetical protein
VGVVSLSICTLVYRHLYQLSSFMFTNIGLRPMIARYVNKYGPSESRDLAWSGLSLLVSCSYACKESKCIWNRRSPQHSLYQRQWHWWVIFIATTYLATLCIGHTITQLLSIDCARCDGAFIQLCISNGSTCLQGNQWSWGTPTRGGVISSSEKPPDFEFPL